jgi:ATP/maltotriose-dependent transcriptional regulator MalT
LCRQVEELAERTGDVDLISIAARQAGTVAHLNGDLTGALAVASRLIEQSLALGKQENDVHVAQRITFRPLLDLGRAEEAMAAHTESAHLAGLDDDTLLTHYGGYYAATRAVILANLGRHSEARDTIRRTLERLQIASADDETPAWSLVCLLEAAILVGDDVAAPMLMSRLAPIASAVIWGLFGASTCVARHLGAAAAMIGDRAAARTYYEQALEIAGRLRFRPEIALTHLHLAELLHDGGTHERAQARAHLAAAIPELEAMAMQPALMKARRLQERLAGAKAARAPAANPDGLSDREVEVLRRIAAGRSNQEIADALVVSVRTVERHAVNIYAKIGARGRTDAVAYAVRHNLADAPPD